MQSDYTEDEILKATRPIQSLISKSEKVLQKLAVHSWQHTMLLNNVTALRVALALMNQSDEAATVPYTEYRTFIRSVESMITRTERALEKFAPATSQSTLLRNRLQALRMAEAILRKRSLGSD